MKNNQISEERIVTALGAASFGNIILYSPNRILQVIISTLIILVIDSIIDSITNRR